jgi:hypothetical protein
MVVIIWNYVDQYNMYKSSDKIFMVLHVNISCRDVTNIMDLDISILSLFSKLASLSLFGYLIQGSAQSLCIEVSYEGNWDYPVPSSSGF